MSFLCFTGSSQRMWALQKLRKLMTSSSDQIVNVNTLLASPTLETAEPDLSTRAPTAVSIQSFLPYIHTLNNLIKKCVFVYCFVFEK